MLMGSFFFLSISETSAGLVSRCRFPAQSHDLEGDDRRLGRLSFFAPQSQHGILLLLRRIGPIL